MVKAPTAHSTDLDIFLGKETEANWEAREANLKALAQFCSDPEKSVADLVKLIHPRYQDILTTLHTPRTQLALQACNFLLSLISRCEGLLFDDLADITFPNLLKLCASTKKLVAKEANKILLAACSKTTAAYALALLGPAMKEKNAGSRCSAMESVKDVASRETSKEIWITIREFIVKGVSDASPIVRSFALDIVELAWANFGSEFILQVMDLLDGSLQKQLKLMLSKRNISINFASLGNKDSGCCLSSPSQSLGSIAIEGDVQPVDEEEEKVRIPLQRINISSVSDVPKPLGPPGPLLSPSRIPRKAIAANLLLSTPYLRKHSRSLEPASSSVVNLNDLIDQCQADDLAPNALLKLLQLSESKQQEWKDYQLSCLWVALTRQLHQTLKSQSTIEIVGLITKNLLAQCFEYTKDLDIIVELLCSLWQFQFEFSASWGPISHWFDLNKLTVEFFALARHPCTAGPTGLKLWLSLLHRWLASDDASRAQATKGLEQLGTDLVLIWDGEEDLLIRRTVVECLVQIRKLLGTISFDTLVPCLSLSQRRVLDAFSTIDE